MRSEEPATRESKDVDPRVVLALERTTLAWTRTALAVMGFGFVVSRLGVFLNELHPSAPRSGQGQWIGLAIVMLGSVLLVVAMVTHAASVRRLRSTGLLRLQILSPALIVSACLGALALVVSAYLASL